MPRRMRRYGRRRAMRRRGRRYGRRRPAQLARKYQGIKYFTEVFRAGTLGSLFQGVTAGGWFTAGISSAINASHYVGLYDLGTITRFDVMLVPNSGDIVSGTSGPGGTLVVSEGQNPFANGAGTIAWLGPPSQLTLLQESNQKIICLDGKRVIKLKCYHPQPAVTQTLVQSTAPPSNPVGPATVAHRKTWTWLNLQNPDAVDNLFGGLQFYVNSVNPTGLAATYDVYVRMYLAFKEQS